MSKDELIAPPVDRRTSSRHAASVPAAILSKDWSVWAVVEDISESGALLFTRESLTVGARVEVAVLLGTQVHPPVRAIATVVRSQERPGVDLLWSHEVAIHFESKSGPWSEALAAVTERQAALRRTGE